MALEQQDQEYRKLRETFDRLPEVERSVLQLLSILFVATNRTNLAACLHDSNVRYDDRRPITSKNLFPIIVKLRKLGLIEDDGRYNDNFKCVDTISNYVIRSAHKDGRFTLMAETVQKKRPAIPSYFSYSNRLEDLRLGLRDICIGVYSHDLESVEKYFKLCIEQYPIETLLKPPMLSICGNPFDPEWFSSLPSSIQAMALWEIVLHEISEFRNTSYIQYFIQNSPISNHQNYDGSRFRKCLVAIHIFNGNIKEARKILEGKLEVSDGVSMWAWLHFFSGNNGPALEYFGESLAELRRVRNKRKIFFPDVTGLFYLLALLKTGDSNNHKLISQFLDEIRKAKTLISVPAYQVVEATLLARQNQIEVALLKVEELSFSVGSGYHLWRFHYDTIEASKFTKLLLIIGRFWIDGGVTKQRDIELKQLYKNALANGQRWAAFETATLLAKYDITTQEYEDYIARTQNETGLCSIVSIVAPEEPWERALTALVDLGSGLSGNKRSSRSISTKRLVWFIHVSEDELSIQPKEQSANASGLWTKGRPVALKKLSENQEQFDYLSEQDRRICMTITAHESGYYGGINYSFDIDRAMLAIVGHPFVFLQDDPTVNVEVVKTEPELLVQQQGGKIRVRFSGNITGSGVMVTQESPTRVNVMEITPAHQRLSMVLGTKGLDIPEAAKPRVLQAVEALSSLVTIHSGIGGTLENVLEIPSDPRPRIHLFPFGVGLRVNLLVKPFNEAGPSFQPGTGGRTIIAEVNGKRAQTHRDLKDEKLRADAAVAACPTLLGTDNSNWDWLIDDPETCLEMLLELQALGDQIVVAWPEGEKFRVTRQVSMDSLRVKIQKDNDWFAFNGTLEIDETLTLEMQRLLDLMQNRESRFIPLGDGQFIALTETLRRRMKEIEALSEKNDQGRRFHPLASLVLQDLSDDVGTFKSDKHWKSHLQRFQQSQDLQPEVPATLQAELREYQVDGFRWLARLSAWGVGACLADDMGLGKTLQALALILYRAAEGPSLVVAPTSVCLNWLSEIDRFAPSLNGIFFGTSQRQDTVAGLKPFDCLICSYGLFELESQLLSSRNWNVVVLDEAQAIKNRLTKRSKAAMALQGSFRMIVTGTPMENHLGELWNLFSFINPGLLGSLDSFNSRFAVPIEKYGDKATGKRLKKLIQPFLLRRIKSQVLEELPSRTEIVLHVEMSSEESAFYEALRRQAVEQIANLEGPAGQNHLQILAEIMKLRRACCNSRLIVPDSPIASTKLDLFWELVAELLENRHKALVFSQFIDHLSIIRELLDEKKVRYQYLDGSTPAKERQRLVNAFQGGEGDLFLISLKAGGLGINLTAADTVIHMDPWWNPAVEDQASDRAHRIGQLRPVTIYRLVTKETIEEKIVDLHRHKRDLADGLLEGGDMSARMSTEDLLRMIRLQS
ncbi:MAG: DEAD/DEAH box helicase [Magnetococcales bacterium]|nr:DEAD/DEAH box helicase [Magnetococcales bacterium]